MKDHDDILSFKSLRIGYKNGRNVKVILPPLTAGARKGELIAIIGRNGIGKSTLLRTLAGLHPPLEGEISYGGMNVREYSKKDLAQIIGYISTEMVRVNSMRVYDLVALGRFPYTNWFGKIDDKDHRIIMDSIEKTGLTALTERFISELSDGERQKAMIARILAQDADIMVMDEPTAFLDIGSKFEILHLMHLLTQKNGKTIIFSTHDLNVALSQADRIWLILSDGMEEGSPEDLMLRGAFENLFDTSVMKYDPDNGTYSFVSDSRGDIYVEGTGIMLHYTRKALNRAGFRAMDGNQQPSLKVPSGDNKLWFFTTNDQTNSFASLYEFVSWICSS
jgi:iron complex transport system ATP-binding protein